MKIIRPEAITALTASNVAETVAVYNAGTTYALKALCRRDTDHGIYESQIAGNVGQSLDDPTKWLRIGPTNKWAMFDAYNETQTVNTTSITAEWDATGRINGMAFLNLDAASITLTMTDATAGVIYNQTVSLVDNSNIGNWHDWLFEPVVRKADYEFKDLPVHFGPHIAVSVNAPGGTAKIGNLVMGMARQFGNTVYGAGLGMLTSSKRDVDDYGNINIVPRSRRKTGTFEVVVEKRLVDEVARTLAEFTDTPCVYVGTGEYASALYFGIWRDWQVVVDQPLTSTLSIQIEGLS